VARVRIFIDFWNFSLGMRDFDPEYRIDWSKLASELVTRAVSPSGSGTYEGTCVYVSIDPMSEGDKKLKDFLANVLNRMPGYEIKTFERKRKNPPTCNTCRAQITTCPACHGVLKRTVEKGVDTAIVTDMLQHAWDKTYEVGVLLSGDRDFIPAVQFLNRHGIKIVHASFTNLGQNLANECWSQIDLSKIAAQLKR
jgi:uncharacterized LabA/DUF88 family protein